MNTQAESGNHLILIIGAGPAGIYGVGKLAEAGHEVILVNRDLKPGGLAEYGIYFNKYKMKEGIRKQFRKILSNPRVHYFGHVRIGQEADLALEEIRDLLRPSAIIVMAGAQGTKYLGIPGEKAPFVYHAKDLVYHYNDLPPFSEQVFPIGNRVAIIGIGNVMVDVAHYLVHARKVSEVVAIARRGPYQRAYVDKEMKAVSANIDRTALREELDRVAPRLAVPNSNLEELYRELTKYYDVKGEEGESPTQVTFRYLSSPKEVLLGVEGRPRAVKVEDTELVAKDGDFSARGLGSYYELPADTVVFAVGDRVDERLGLPVRGAEYVTDPHPDPDHAGDEEYQAYDPHKGERLEGIFVAGWSRRASDGLVGKAKQDGERGVLAVNRYLARLDKGDPVDIDAKLEALRHELNRRDIRFVEYSEVRRLEEIEQGIASSKGLDFFKYATDTEMFEAIQSVASAPG